MMRTENKETEAIYTKNIALSYMIAKRFVIEEGFAPEIDWQESTSLMDLTEQVFLQEYAWVVLSAGMSELVVNRKFKKISEAFFHWESSKEVSECKDVCINQALQHFNHFGKINAIYQTTAFLSQIGFEEFHINIQSGGVNYLSRLPYMGPATSLHLAKNIGIRVAKPDRHLVRITEKVEFQCPQSLCEAISELTAEDISVIDLVLWRYATIRKDYLKLFDYSNVH